VKILIADDHQLVREGLKLLVSQLNPTFDFSEAEDFKSLKAVLRVGPLPAVAIIDLHMPGAELGEGVASISGEYPSLPLVVVSAFSSPDVIRKTLALSSVFAFVSKNGSPSAMELALNAALSRHKIGDASASTPAAKHTPDLLAPRLSAVRSLLREGKSNKAIALELGLSEGTVKNYMSEIFKMLKVTNRTQAARIDS
jgi:DNA-binding NarL/FixJ family response regulator